MTEREMNPERLETIRAERGPCAGQMVSLRPQQREILLPHPEDSTKLCEYLLVNGPQGPKLLYEGDVRKPRPGECGERQVIDDRKSFIACTLRAGHAGEHRDAVSMSSWPNHS